VEGEPIWQVTSRSSDTEFHYELYWTFCPFNTVYTFSKEYR